MKASRRLPFQVGIQFVVALREGGFHALRDGVVVVADGHGEIVARRVMSEVGAPVAAAHLLVLGPAVECRGGEMENHQSLAAAHVVDQRRISALAPAQLGLAAVVVADDDEVVGRQGLRAGAAELFGDTHLEAAAVFEQFAQHRRGAAPIVAGGVLSGDDEGLQFRRRRLGGRERTGSQQEQAQTEEVHDLASHGTAIVAPCSGARYVTFRM